jgi:hypothetical protein
MEAHEGKITVKSEPWRRHGYLLFKDLLQNPRRNHDRQAAPDQGVKQSHLREREILTADYDGVGVALAFDIKPTHGHYHRTFAEIYGPGRRLTLQFYDPPTTGSGPRICTNELAVISKDVHHKVIEASSQNRLCVLTVPTSIRRMSISR